MASDDNTVTCSICNKPFAYPKALREVDRGFARALGGQNGEACDECSEIIIAGSPEQLDQLVAIVAATPTDEPEGSEPHTAEHRTVERWCGGSSPITAGSGFP